MPVIPKDIVGQRFHRWLVLSELPRVRKGKQLHRQWLCRCDCGTEKIRDLSKLKNFKSCGCLQKEIVKKIVQKIQPAMRFGYLVTVEMDRTKDSSEWICNCDCGAITSVRSYRLLRGKEKSCGCRSAELRIAAWKLRSASEKTKYTRSRFWDYQKSARDKNHPFEFTFDQIVKFLNSNCYYCDVKAKDCNKELMGIDRVDNSKGYVADNCVPCCWMCNRKKAALSFSDFTGWVTRVANNLKKKGVADPATPLKLI